MYTMFKMVNMLKHAFVYTSFTGHSTPI
uniref:Uncharacterized protein n=1 Tax=Anguilla anguilla TaxID=7936 RepID=A0A0E9XTE5_ANGAN